MVEDTYESWASQPDVCRCCLSTSGTWDMSASYINHDKKEVYSDMLQQCLGISLSHLSEWGPSRLICKLCVGHLRDAWAFWRQVSEAEKHFVDYFERKHQDYVDPEVTVKTEYEDEMCCISDDFSTFEYDAKDSVPKVKIKPEKFETIKTRRRKVTTHKTRLRVKIDKVSVESKDDSDTPLSKLHEIIEKESVMREVPLLKEHWDKKQLYSLEANEKEQEILVKDRKQTASNLGGPGKEYPKNGTKQISERKRVRLTCHTVLKLTSACPFRHHKSWFQCFYCSEDFMEINLLRNHTFQHHTDVDSELKTMKRYPRSLQIDISDLKCNECLLSLIDVETMKKHFEDHHNKVIYNECIADYKVDTSPYVCHLCKLEFHVFRSLTMHLNEHYANCICDICGKSFINSKRLKVHKRTHESGQFPCSECGKILKTKTSKANHMESAHSKRVLKCQICSKPMKHYNDRIKHMSEAHNITHKFKCPICPREYNIKHYLATHVRQTHGNKNKKCSECNMAFITNHGLKKHMLKHTGEKPYSCIVCYKTYARSYTLKEHMRAHEGDRNFLCSE